MNTKIKTEIKTILELDEKEVTWLHNISQNAIQEDESKEDFEIRANFFEATK